MVVDPKTGENGTRDSVVSCIMVSDKVSFSISGK